MSRQSQEVAESGLAIQSGGDTIVHNGFSQEQVKEIIAASAGQFMAHFVSANALFETRLSELEKRILERFDTDPSARAEAFGDPDFLFGVLNAQKAFARSGEKDVAEMLVELISERSKSTERDRLALSLNQAIEVAVNLTANEFAALSFVYLLRYTQTGVGNFENLAATLNQRINPFIDNLSKEDSSYQYLVAQRCATISLASVSLRGVLTQYYAAFFMRGAPISSFGSGGAALQAADLLVPSIHGGELFQPYALNKETWNEVTERAGVDPLTRDSAWTFAQGTLMGQDEIIETYSERIPRLKEAFEVWDATPLKSLELTTIGVAIGHAHSKSAGFDFDLQKWIK